MKSESRLETSNDEGAEMVRLEGALTIERAHELKDILLGALTSGRDVLLNMESVTEVDLSCLQLLCAAHKASLNAPKPLSIQGARPIALSQAMWDAGFLRKLGCRAESKKSCLWIGAEE